MFAKKSLGQYFLRSRAALLKIAGAANLSRDDIALEVGPGEGALTELLLERAGKVIAVEKDERLISRLQQRFVAEIASGKLYLIHSDILSISPTNYLLLATNYKVVSNLPYYITGQFLRRSLQSDCQPSSMTLLLQKEVAKRIVAKDKRESILSISVKCYGQPHYIETIKSSAFFPRPKVDSAIIAIEDISKDFFEDSATKKGNLDSRICGNDREKTFFSMLKKGFAHPRKLLTSNLKTTPEMLARCGVSQKARAENLSLEQWKCLALLHA